jgi:hypothetical protein
VNNCFSKAQLSVRLYKSADILILLEYADYPLNKLLTNILLSIYHLIPLYRYRFADFHFLGRLCSAQYSSLKKSRLTAITESEELLPVCGQLMTYLMKKRKSRLTAITESGELLPCVRSANDLLNEEKEISAPAI